MIEGNLLYFFLLVVVSVGVLMYELRNVKDALLSSSFLLIRLGVVAILLFVYKGENAFMYAFLITFIAPRALIEAIRTVSKELISKVGSKGEK